ncbi:hypothetical protein PENSPDRAFT_754901 [Peniophora sp. CONT]|nr:hypothetical protein PENSPDRAFT_754901 [Peniophora sp. CONT]
MTGKSDAEVIELFHEQVNMSADELDEWLADPQSKKAGTGVGHDSGEHIAKILRGNPDKDPEKYSAEDLQHMHKVVAYNSRHLKQEDHLKETKTTEKLEKTKSTISLKNWGHDPVKVKKQQDGELPVEENGDAEPVEKEVIDVDADETEEEAQPAAQEKEKDVDAEANAEMKGTDTQEVEDSVEPEDDDKADVGQKRKRNLRSADKPASKGKPESQSEPKAKRGRASSTGETSTKKAEEDST